MATIDRERIKNLIKREEETYIAKHPVSKKLFEKANNSLLGGVPLIRMARWEGPFPLFAKEGKDAHLTDVDGYRYLDLCMGDSPAMFGHSPSAIMEKLREQMGRGVTLMLPNEDAIWVGEELTRRFHLSHWEIYLSASNANRFAIRVAREMTKRKLILVFNACFHGMVDEAMVELRNGVLCHRRSLGPFTSPESMARVIEFNDIGALEAALSPRDIACVICEPVMTNEGIIYPDPGYLDALRELTRRFGTLMIIDETHTICSGPEGLTGAWNLDPDIFTLGKSIGGGMIPAAVIGLSQQVAEFFMRRWHEEGAFFALGTTMSSNLLSITAIRATLEHLMTEPIYKLIIRHAEELENGIDVIIKDSGLPWHVNRLGCRAEYRFYPTPFKNGSEAQAASDAELDTLIHLFFINRDILISPFHNMLLVSPEISAEDIHFHNRVFREFVNDLIG